MNLATVDIVVIALYGVGILALAQWVSREKAGHEKETSDYFLASKNLPWWAIGSSLIAAGSPRSQRFPPSRCGLHASRGEGSRVRVEVAQVAPPRLLSEPGDEQQCGDGRDDDDQ